MLYSVCLLGRLEGWDVLAVPEWSRRSGSVSRRGGQTGGVFPWSFLFLASLRARARARRVIPLVWRLRTGGGVAPSHSVAGGWRLGTTSREKPCPGSFPKRRRLCLPGCRGVGAGDSHHPPSPAPLPLAPARRADRAAVRARRAPRSVQLFPPGPKRGSGWGWGRHPGGLASRERFRPAPCSSATLHTGAGTHLPKGAWRDGRLCGKERAPETCGGCGTDRKPPASPGGIRIFSQREANSFPWSPFSPKHVRTLWNITPSSLAPNPTCEVRLAGFSYSPASPPCTPGVCQG